MLVSILDSFALLGTALITLAESGVAGREPDQIHRLVREENLL